MRETLFDFKYSGVFFLEDPKKQDICFTNKNWNSQQNVTIGM